MTFWEHIKYLFRIIFLPNSLRTMEWKMLKLVNKDRKQHGLKSLRMQQDLREVARKHSKDMARKDYFEHENTTGQSPFDRLEEARVTDIVAGENLAKIRGFKNPVVKAEIGLMNSPGHRANILNKEYNTVGIGIITAVDNTFYYTQNFAARDLVLTKKVPNKIRIKKGLRIKGEVFTKGEKILFQIKKHENDKEPLEQGVVHVKDGKFDFVIPFKNTGIFTILIFLNHKGSDSKYKLVNKFEIKVKTSWF